MLSKQQKLLTKKSILINSAVYCCILRSWIVVFMVMASKRSARSGTVQDIVNSKKSKAGRTNAIGQPKTGEVEPVTLTMSDPTASQTKKGTSRQTRSNSNFSDFEHILRQSETVTLPTYTHKTNKRHTRP